MVAAVTGATQLLQRRVEIQHSAQSPQLVEATAAPEGARQQMVVRVAAVVGIIRVKVFLLELSAKVIRVAVQTAVVTELVAAVVALREPVEMLVVNILAVMAGPEPRH